MSESILKGKDIAQETFNLMSRIFVWKNAMMDTPGMAEAPFREGFKSYEKKFLILFFISNFENCTLSRLEQGIFEKRSTVSIAVSKLCEKGLLSKYQPGKGDDGRKVYFRITKKGQEALDAYREEFLSNTSCFIEKLSEEGKKYFMQGIMSLNKAFEEQEKAEGKY